MAIIFLGLVGVAAVLAIIGVFIAAIVVAGCIFLFVVYKNLFDNSFMYSTFVF